jgi:hypothetical protein
MPRYLIGSDPNSHSKSPCNIFTWEMVEVSRVLLHTASTFWRIDFYWKDLSRNLPIPPGVPLWNSYPLHTLDIFKKQNKIHEYK